MRSTTSMRGASSITDAHNELLERNADYARLVNAYDVDEEGLE
ncbi:MAG: hypothetical protein V9E81_02855 [Marmoricola sp.]